MDIETYKESIRKAVAIGCDAADRKKKKTEQMIEAIRRRKLKKENVC